MDWTDEKIELLKSLFPTSNWSVLREHFPECTENAIRCIARKQKLKREKRQPVPGAWTNEELRILKEEYKVTPINQLVKKLEGRTLKAAASKAEEMGLRKHAGSNWNFSRNIQPVHAAYLAAYLDADGCIQISAFSRKSGSLEINPIVHYCSNSPEQINYLLELMIDPHLPDKPFVGEKKGAGYRKPCFDLVLTGIRRLPIFLHQILPYLHLKRRQAEVVLEFCELRETYLYHSYGLRELLLAEEMRKLNDYPTQAKSHAVLQNMIAERLHSEGTPKT